MIKNCPMRHENGNCIPAGGFCTANKNICEALHNAYRMGKAQLFCKGTTSDLISRQAVLDLVTDMEFMNFTAKGILRDSLRKLPPAQPEPKQIISETRAIPSDNDLYYSTLHERVAKCVSDLRDHFRLGYIVDPCGGIQALEITTKELMNY